MNLNVEYKKDIIERYFRSEGSKWNSSETEYFTKNPLRDDKNIGSFHISKNGLFFDHATGEGGHITKLLMDKYNYSYIDALKELDTYDENYQSLNPDYCIEKYEEWYDENGKPLYVCFNRDRSRASGKDTWWSYSLDQGKSWKPGKNKQQTSLYNIKRVIDAKNIIMVEGEGCVESLERFLTKTSDYAVTTTGSATSWSAKVAKTAVKLLKGKKVYILPDNDEPGEKYALNIAKSLKTNDIEYYIVDLPGLKDIEIIKNGKKTLSSQDIKDWIKAGNSLETLLETLKSSKIKKPLGILSEEKKKMTWVEFYREFPDLDKITALNKVFTHIYEKRFNTILNQSEYREIGSEKWKIVNDREISTLWVELLPHLKLICDYVTKDMIRSVLESISDHDYDPFLEWTQQFQSKQSTVELDKFFSLIELEKIEKSEIFRKIFTKWMVATISLMSGKTNKNEICPVISGAQGIGKNRLIEKLFESLENKYLFTGSLQADNKDSRKRISTMAVIHLDEFDATTKKSDISILKSLITATEFTDRLAYGRLDVTLNRKASFIASINFAIGILVDETGNRRFPTFRVKSIDLENLLKLDTNALWSEIKYLSESGEVSCFLSKEELLEVESGNDEFRKIDQFEEYIREFYRPVSSQDYHIKVMVSSNDFVSYVNNDYITKNMSPTKIGRTLTKLGYKQDRESNFRKFILYKKV